MFLPNSAVPHGTDCVENVNQRRKKNIFWIMRKKSIQRTEYETLNTFTHLWLGFDKKIHKKFSNFYHRNWYLETLL